MDQDVTRDMFMLLHEVARLIRVEADKRARVHAMTLAQWTLLIRLERNPGLSQKEAADLLEVEPISVARLVDRLEANGLVERRPDANDRRIWRLHLLPMAAPLLKKMAVQRLELADFVSAGVTQDTREMIKNGLMQMKINLLQTQAAQSMAAIAYKETA